MKENGAACPQGKPFSIDKRTRACYTYYIKEGNAYV